MTETGVIYRCILSMRILSSSKFNIVLSFLIHNYTMYCILYYYFFFFYMYSFTFINFLHLFIYYFDQIVLSKTSTSLFHARSFSKVTNGVVLIFVALLSTAFFFFFF